MNTGASEARGYRFGGYRVDPVTRELFGIDGAVVPLSGKAFDVLCLLIDHRDRIVGKDELLSRVWVGRIVEENNLSQAIGALRRALRSDDNERRVIITVPGRGYRFVADLEQPAAATSAADRLDAQPDALPAGRDAVEQADRRTAEPSAPVPAPVGRRAWRWQLAAVAAMVVAVIGGITWQRTVRQPTATDRLQPAAIAVLPFRQLSSGPVETILQLGIPDTVVARLGSRSTLVVRTLDASLRLRPRGQSPQDIGRRLGVGYLVDGSTQRVGDRLRINSRLISTVDGRTLWTQTFDTTSDALFGVQDQIAASIAERLAPGVRPAWTRARSSCDGDDVVAYRAYLAGRYQNERPDSARLQLAIDDFRIAIDRDPRCARGYAGLAFAYRAMVMTGDRRPRELFPLARAAVDRALAIDPMLADAYASRGWIEFWYDWNWPAAERSFRQAIRLNPALPEAHLGYAHLLTNLGRGDQAAVEIRRALQADPLSPLINALAPGFLEGAGFDEEARAQLARAMEVAPDFWVVQLAHGGDAMGRGDSAEALASLRRARRLSHDNSQALVVLAFAELRAGDRAGAEHILAQMNATDAASYVPATSLAAVELALGRRDAAMDLLERAYEERDVRLSFLRIDGRFAALRGTPRFDALLRRMRLDKPSAVSGLQSTAAS